MTSVVENDIGRVATALVASDEAGYSRSDLLRCGRRPVAGDGVPEHRLHAQLAGDAQRGRTASSKGWAEVAHRRTKHLLQLGRGAGQLFVSALCACDCQVGMGPGMVADHVASLMD